MLTMLRRAVYRAMKIIIIIKNVFLWLLVMIWDFKKFIASDFLCPCVRAIWHYLVATYLSWFIEVRFREMMKIIVFLCILISKTTVYKNHVGRCPGREYIRY